MKNSSIEKQSNNAFSYLSTCAVFRALPSTMDYNRMRKYAASFCKLLRAIGKCVDRYRPLRKDIKFYLYSTKLLSLLSRPGTVKKVFRSIGNTIRSATPQERIQYVFESIIGIDKIVGSVFTIVKMIKTANRVNDIVKFWIPYYEIVDIPIDILKIILKIKSVHHYLRLRSDLLALEEKAASSEEKAPILLQMIDRINVEKISFLQKKLYIPGEINLSEQIDEHKKIIMLSASKNNEKAIEDTSVFIKNLSSRICVKCRCDKADLLNDIFGVVVTVVLFSFAVSTPVSLAVPIITASASLLLKIIKDIAFRRCV